MCPHMIQVCMKGLREFPLSFRGKTIVPTTKSVKTATMLLNETRHKIETDPTRKSWLK